MFDLRLQRRQGDPHGAADLHGADGGALQTLRRMTGGHHAFAHLADHVDDVVADRADHGAASAHGAAVVDQGLPFGQLFVGDRLAQTQFGRELAPEGVLLLPQPPHGFELADGRVLGVAAFGVEQAGVGTHAAVHAAGEERGHGRVDLFAQRVEAFVETDAHARTPRRPANAPLYQREKKMVIACISLVNGSTSSSNSMLNR